MESPRRLCRSLVRDKILRNGIQMQLKTFSFIAFIVIIHSLAWLCTQLTVVSDCKSFFIMETSSPYPFSAFPTVLLMEKVNVRWHLWGEATLAVLSIIDAGMLGCDADPSLPF